MTEFLIGVMGAALVNVLTLDKASNPDTLERLKRAATMGGVTILVTLAACAASHILYYGVLSPLGLGAACVPLCFLAAIGSAWGAGCLARNAAGPLAAFVQDNWPLAALNAVAFGAAAHGIQTGAGFAGTLLTAFAASALFALSLTAMAAIVARMDADALPDSVRGFPALLLTAALVSMALMAFAGL